MNSFVKDGDRYRLDLYEKKTGKFRNFTVPAEIYQYVRDYACQNGIGQKARLFPITERAVLKYLKATADFENSCAELQDEIDRCVSGSRLRPQKE